MFTSSKPRHDDEGASDAAEMRSQKLGLCPETPTERAVASQRVVLSRPDAGGDMCRIPVCSGQERRAGVWSN